MKTPHLNKTIKYLEEFIACEDKDSIYPDIDPTKEKLEEYKELMERYADKNLEIVSLRLKAMAEQNDSVYAALTTQEERLLRSKYLASVNYALTQKEFEIAPYVMANEVEGLSKKYLDTVYNALPQKIKDSKYGKDLESLINKQTVN